MSGEISRANWVVPVQSLTRTGAEGIVRLVACRDGSVTLHVSCADAQGMVRLDVSRAAQLSTGIWEAAGASQRLTGYLDDDPPARPRLPPLPARSGKPAVIGRRPAVAKEGAAMEAEQARTIGARLRRIRRARRKPLKVIAGLAGMGKSTLDRIERGQRGITLSEIIALASALEIAPSELTTLPVPAPANGPTDSTIHRLHHRSGPPGPGRHRRRLPRGPGPARSGAGGAGDPDPHSTAGLPVH